MGLGPPVCLIHAKVMRHDESGWHCDVAGCEVNQGSDSTKRSNLFCLNASHISEHEEMEMRTPKIDLNYNMDAMDWAKEFMAHFGGERRSEIDEGTMLAWFANAIMTGYDVGRSKFRKELGHDDPAAFRKAVEELVEINQTSNCACGSWMAGKCRRCNKIDELSALLPANPETPDAR